jgi:hypothetical protein
MKREVGNKLQSQMTGKNRANLVLLPVGQNAAEELTEKKLSPSTGDPASSKRR